MRSTVSSSGLAMPTPEMGRQHSSSGSPSHSTLFGPAAIAHPTPPLPPSSSASLPLQPPPHGPSPAASIGSPSLGGGRRGVIPAIQRTHYRFSDARAKFTTLEEHLRETGTAQVKRERHGSVLVRGSILKTDHYHRDLNPELDVLLHGAPNYRAVDLNIHGCSQPTLSGLATLLTFLGGHPEAAPDRAADCTWFSTREEPLCYINDKPFVLRHEDKPKENIKAYAGISANRIEQMESRLKEDVIREAHKCGGLILVHDELGDGTIVPIWVAPEKVQTPREVYASFAQRGYRIRYHRIPISPEQRPEDKYVDEYARIIKDLGVKHAIIFNCGMGVGRTTFAMTVAVLIRRVQMLRLGEPDPFPFALIENKTDEMVANNDLTSMAMLRLVYVLEQGLVSKMSPRSAIEWALARSSSLANLKAAISGNYQIITALSSVLDKGAECKKLLDEVINRCDSLLNIREVILMHRVSFSNTDDTAYLEKALNCLERYFFLLAFTAYCNESFSQSPDTPSHQSFSRWLQHRPEIWSSLEHLRKKGPRLTVFRPVDDLTVLGAPDAGEAAYKNVVRARTGTVLGAYLILKADRWVQEIHGEATVDGADNYRKTPSLPIHGVAQPTLAGIRNVLDRVAEVAAVPGTVPLQKKSEKEAMEDQETVRRRQRGQDDVEQQTVCWINLREEPLIYINGVPYVLRDEAFTLRNIKSYSGITSHRLELIEQRLKDDVLQEIARHNGRILVHTEVSEGVVLPQWEEVSPENVLTLREAMAIAGQYFSDTTPAPRRLQYHRIPMTAEEVPDATDLDNLLKVIGQYEHARTDFVLNCQIGVGRSTFGTIVAMLTLNWLRAAPLPSMPTPAKPAYEYQVIYTLLRVIKSGLETKMVVDDAIQQCAATYNLRSAIEHWRVQVDNEAEEHRRGKLLRKGLACLKRYFVLIAYQAYLNAYSPDSLQEIQRFREWMDRHMEFQTILGDMEKLGERALLPVAELRPGDGVALTTEVASVVATRKGAVLAQSMILKDDHFPGCQKLSLHDRIEGAPNFRGLLLNRSLFSMMDSGAGAGAGGGAGAGSASGAQPVGSSNGMAPASTTGSASSLNEETTAHAHSSVGGARSAERETTAHRGSKVFGVAMPTASAIKEICQRTGAGQSGQRVLYWTSLREEPVLYINGHPYVLRTVQDPLKNLEATGIERERVEQMEFVMKRDVLEELQRYGGRCLLHGEQPAPNGGYAVVATWETVEAGNVLTPSEVFQQIKDEGFRVNYLRLPITDEQAPIPIVFDFLVERIRDITDIHDVLFNCQMGRGRTSTGMVIAVMMELVRNGGENGRDLTALASVSSPVSLMPPIHQHPLHEASTSNDELDATRFIAGEYKIILQLLTMLPYGKIAKRIADVAINACSHVQNLRAAIYDFKLRCESTSETPPQKLHALIECGLNYLMRYFYLITFAEYLLEEPWVVRQGAGQIAYPPELPAEKAKMTQNQQAGETLMLAASTDVHSVSDRLDERLKLVIAPTTTGLKFSDWLLERREISALAQKNQQSFQ